MFTHKFMQFSHFSGLLLIDEDLADSEIVCVFWAHTECIYVPFAIIMCQFLLYFYIGFTAFVCILQMVKLTATGHHCIFALYKDNPVHCTKDV